MLEEVTWGYSRLSTKDMGLGITPEQHISRLVQAGCPRENILFELESGRKDKRKEFQKLLRLIEQDQVKRLFIVEISRLSRRVITLSKVYDLLHKHQVELICLSHPVDLNSAFGRSQIHQMAVYAQFEVDLLTERINHSFNHLRSKSKPLTGKLPFGYKKSSDGYITPDPESWEMAKKMIEIYLQETKLRSACTRIYQELGIKRSIAGLRDWLKNPTLRGHTVYHRWHEKDESKYDYRYNTHEPLISEGEYLEIINLLEYNRTHYGFNAGLKRSDHPLAGLVYCIHCRGKLSKHTARKGRKTMCCATHGRDPHRCKGVGYISYDQILNAVIAELCLKADNLANLALEPEDTLPSSVRQIDAELTALRSIKNPSFAVTAAISELESNRNLELNKQNLKSSDWVNAELKRIFEVPEFWETATDEDLTWVLTLFVEQVWCDYHSVVEIFLKI